MCHPVDERVLWPVLLAMAAVVGLVVYLVTRPHWPRISPEPVPIPASARRADSVIDCAWYDGERTCNTYVLVQSPRGSSGQLLAREHRALPASG